MTDFLVVLIDDALERRGLSSREAASQIGITHTTLNRIRQGGTYDLKTARMITKWLGVKTSTVLDATEENEDPLAAQVAAMIEMEPGLARLFAKAAARVQSGKMKPETFRELARYVAYRLDNEDMLGDENEKQANT
jgi:transcriptional regulator with XRE-family HTH domain